MNTAVSLAALVCAASMIVAGCSDEPADKAKRPATAPAAAPPAAAPAATVSLEPRYEATLAQGIEFGKPGYPSFLREVQGISNHEPWGRWSDANLSPTVRLRFAQPLPAKFTLELNASGLGPNAYEAVKVRAGGVEKTLVLGNPSKGMQRLAFEGVSGDTIEIVPPTPIRPREVTPGNTDPRMVGVGLESLKILE
jgi:phosphoglycerol transferase